MEKKKNNIFVLFVKWGLTNTLGNRRFKAYIKEFPYIWLLLLALLFVAVISVDSWSFLVKMVGVILALITALVLIRPMNAVYGLMGTSGSIRLFFINFLMITMLFAGVYYCAFFKYAGITYDVNQPHIDYVLFAPQNHVDSKEMSEPENNIFIKTTEKRNTVFLERQLDTVSFKETIVQVTLDTLHYQKIDFWQVWRSSILTTLTQEPADLLTAATIHNFGMDSTDVVLDRQKSSVFEWIMIFHVIISWIFFGMFISLLYNKFRYES